MTHKYTLTKEIIVAQSAAVTAQMAALKRNSLQYARTDVCKHGNAITITHPFTFTFTSEENTENKHGRQ